MNSFYDRGYLTVVNIKIARDRERNNTHIYTPTSKQIANSMLTNRSVSGSFVISLMVKLYNTKFQRNCSI